MKLLLINTGVWILFAVSVIILLLVIRKVMRKAPHNFTINGDQIYLFNGKNIEKVNSESDDTIPVPCRGGAFINGDLVVFNDSKNLAWIDNGSLKQNDLASPVLKRVETIPIKDPTAALQWIDWTPDDPTICKEYRNTWWICTGKTIYSFGRCGAGSADEFCASGAWELPFESTCGEWCGDELIVRPRDCEYLVALHLPLDTVGVELSRKITTPGCNGGFVLIKDAHKNLIVANCDDETFKKFNL